MRVFNLLSWIVPLSISSLAFGGAGGHGGDSLRSTLQEVNFALAIATSEATAGILPVMREIKKELDQPGEALHISDPSLRKVFIKMLGSGTDFPKSPIAQDFAQTHFKNETDKGCEFIKGSKKKAGVAKNQLGVDICVNRPLFEDLPPEALPAQFTEIIGHEFSHHFGADEKLAVRVQKFISYKLNNECIISIALKNSDEKLSRNILIFPRKWHYSQGHPDIPPHSTSITVENKTFFIHKEPIGNLYLNYDSYSDINLETNNSADEFSMSIVKNGPSQVKLMVLNSDLSRTPVEVKWNNLDDIVPSQSKGPVYVSGTIDGKTLSSDRVAVENGCFNQ